MINFKPQLGFISNLSSNSPTSDTWMLYSQILHNLHLQSHAPLKALCQQRRSQEVDCLNIFTAAVEKLCSSFSACALRVMRRPDCVSTLGKVNVLISNNYNFPFCFLLYVIFVLWTGSLSFKWDKFSSWACVRNFGCSEDVRVPMEDFFPSFNLKQAKIPAVEKYWVGSN